MFAHCASKFCIARALSLVSTHIYYAPDAVTSVHVVECFVDLVKRLSVRDELVDLQSALLPVFHESRKLGPALDASKRASLPDTAGDQLERSCRDLSAGRCYTNDDGLAPA